MKATLTNYRQSPRKVALVAGLIRGKKVSIALQSLKFTTKRATDPIYKLLNSAIANAKNSGISNPEDLFINEIRVDKGIILKRFMPRARGSSAPIWKRSSHVYLTLGEKPVKGKANKASVSETTDAKSNKKTSTKKVKSAKAEKVVKATKNKKEDK